MFATRMLLLVLLVVPCGAGATAFSVGLTGDVNLNAQLRGSISQLLCVNLTAVRLPDEQGGRKSSLVSV